MTIETFTRVGLVPGLGLLPERMDTREARVLILAICLQESDLMHRVQRVWRNRLLMRGPARGYAQFERAGVRGVLGHRASAEHAQRVCAALDIEATPDAVHTALEYHDPLCAAMARLLLWTLPEPLPSVGDEAAAWRQYLAAWRPGAPKPDRWPARYRMAMEATT